MRRLAAIFVPKRSDRSDASDTLSESHSSVHTAHSSQSKTKLRSSFLRSFSSRNDGLHEAKPAEEKHKRHPMPPLVRTDPPSSSSSSSAGPRTPDDDFTTRSGQAWLPGTSHASRRPSTFSQNSALNVKRPTNGPTALASLWHEDSEDETSSEEASSSEVASEPLSKPISPVAYFRTLTINAIAPPSSPPPLLHVPGNPLFPRSCNLSRTLSPNETLRSSMHRKHLLRRIQQGKLTRSDEGALAKGFSNKHRAPTSRKPSLRLDDNALRDGQRIERFSQGLKRWLSRPYFEERMVLYHPTESGEVVTTSVPGITLGVAELEFSEALELLAGLYESRNIATDMFSPATSPPNMTPPLSTTPSSSGILLNAASSSVSASAPAPLPAASSSAPSLTDHEALQQTSNHSQNRNMHKPAPSPLRIEHSASAPSLSMSPSETSTVKADSPTIVISPSSPEPSRSGSPPSIPQPKRGVRFAEDTKDDLVPLGYVLRSKQRREQKARFLQAERERRTREEELKKQAEEQRRQEEEKVAWERRQRAMMEEEQRKKRLYAEEVAAARDRRQSIRLGSNPKIDSEHTWINAERTVSPERKQAEETYTRPVYDTNAPTGRRQSSPPMVQPTSRQREGSSSGSSRPPSLRNSGSQSGSVRGSSRPPSMYSTPQSSNPDISLRDRRDSSKAGSRRGSFVSAADAQRPMFDQSTFPPPAFYGSPWNMNMNMNMYMGQAIPPIPPLPTMPYMMDMPLIPPTPPFMMQQYGPRPQQQRSHSSSPTTSSTHRLPASQSSDRVNQVRHHERRASGGDVVAEMQRPKGNVPRSSSHEKSSKSSTPSTSPGPHTPKDRSSSNSGSGSGSASPSHGRSPSRRSPSTAPSSYFECPRQKSPQPPVPPVPSMPHSWTQPAFQNLSRPQPNRRQTMIS